MKAEKARRLRNQIALRSELGLLPHLDEANGLTLLFSAKESLYKALYPHTQRFMGFEAACLRQSHDGLLLFELTQNWNETWTSGQTVYVRFNLDSQYVHTLAWWPQNR